MVQISRLEGFYWVARTGGYARAARAFPYPITQPGVYQQVRKLEEALETRLLERVAKDRMRLTPAGETLYRFCAPFFAGLPDVLRTLQTQTFAGTLRLDAAGLVLRELMPPWIRRLRRARPDIAVELEEIQNPDFERLRDGRADLLVDFIPALPSDCASQVVANSYAFLVLPAEHPLALRGPALELHELQQLPLISYHPNVRLHAVQMAAVREHIGAPQRVLAATSVDAILAFVSAGLGYSVVPWLDERGPTRAGVAALRPPQAQGSYEIHAVWRRSEPPNPLVQAALELAPRAAAA